jgi:hypothetical protein
MKKPDFSYTCFLCKEKYQNKGVLKHVCGLCDDIAFYCHSCISNHSIQGVITLALCTKGCLKIKGKIIYD